MNRSIRSLLRTFALSSLLLASLSTAQAVDPRSYAVEASATVQAAPPQITLRWTQDVNAVGYTVYRKAPAATSWTWMATLGSGALTWNDVSVSNGASYEYAITKSTSAGYAGTGYLLAGINVPAVENRGKVVLIVDSTFTSSLASELARLQQDLVGDGWTVLRHDVFRWDSVATVKNFIKADYNADPANVKSVFLFGHIPVPYSGDLNPPPDGHPEHQGAWPADAYYGDMNGVWTDTSVNNTAGNVDANHNVPGDGKFDQSDLPSDVDLQVGRVDLSNMTCFSNKTPSRSELDLLRAYLNKDHNFRTGAMFLPRRGLIRDSFGDIYGENFASSGWRNSAAFFGAENSFAAPYGGFFSTLRDNAYLFAYGTGGGSYTTCDGVGGSDDFALTDIKAVFTAFLGSYFGDWDNESAFLRAPLGSGYCLASAWAGRPHWFLHHMALGETIGYSTRISQNNNAGGLYSTQNWGTHRIHIALMGDPTLRLHPVIPPSNASATTSSGVSVNWSASPDSNIQGYLVYRGSSVNGPFTKVSGNSLLSTTGLTDPAGTAGSVYMIRAVKLEQSAGGTYYNPSLGTFATASAPVAVAPSAPSNLSGTALSSSAVKLQWTDNSGNEAGFKLLRKTGVNGGYTTLSLGANVTSYTDSVAPGTQYFYKVSAFNGGGESSFSPEISVTTPAALVNGAFLASDRTTGGSWKGVYGSEGYNVIGDKSAFSIPLAMSPSGQTQWIWSWLASDNAALQRASENTRLAGAWYSFKPINVSFTFSGPAHHKLTVYCLDWNGGARQQTVEILDANQTILQSQTIGSFQKGVYLTFDVTGAVTLRVRPIVGSAVLSGIFVDPLPVALPLAAAPAFTPGAGTIVAGQAVTLSTTTAGATIRYTIDGSAPTASSAIYNGPITLSTSTVLSARTFASGMADSAVATASFSVTSSASGLAGKVSFLGIDATRQGSWKGEIGTEAYSIPGDVQSAPTSIGLSASGKNDWLWEYSSLDARALQRASLPSRVASCSYSSSFQYDIDLRDGRTHNVSVYCLDWDRANRIELVEVLDATTGTVLHSYKLSAFTGGVYINYALKGRVTVRLTATQGPNAVLSGLFVDPSAIQL